MKIKLSGWGMGLVAALAGQLALGATYYWNGGSSDISGGTALKTALTNLSGTWNTTTKNWAVDYAGASYTNWNNAAAGNHAYFGRYMTNWVANDVATNTLAGDVTLERLTADFDGLGNIDGTFYLTAAAPVSLTLSGSNPRIIVENGVNYKHLSLGPNVRLAGINGFTKLGLADLYIKSDCSGLTGTVTMNDVTLWQNGASDNQRNDSYLLLSGAGTLSGISRFNLAGGVGNTLGFTVQAPAGGVQNQIGDSAVINMLVAGCPLVYKGYRGSPYSQETIDSIVLSSAGKLDLSSTSGSGANGQLILANSTAGINRGTDGKGTLTIGVDATGTARVDCVVQNGVATGSVLPWMMTTRGQPVQLNASKVITPLATTVAPTDLSTWASGQNYVMTNTTNTVYTGLIPNLTLDTLTHFAQLDGNMTNTIGAGNTLTLTHGMLGRAAVGGAGKFILTGGKITSGTSELNIILGDWYQAVLGVDSEITGNIGLVIGGDSILIIGGTPTNSYTGTTYVMGGELDLNKNNGAPVIPGDLVVGYAYIVNKSTTPCLSSNANVTLRNGGKLRTYSSSQTYSATVTLEDRSWLIGDNGVTSTFNKPGTGLVMNGGTLVNDGNGGTSPFYLLTDVSYATDSAQPAAIRLTWTNTLDTQYLYLCNAAGNYSRTFNIGKSSYLSGKPEMEISMMVAENTGTAGFTKTGAGTLSLRRASYNLSGPVTINGGTLISAGSWNAVSRQGMLHMLSGVIVHDYTVTDLPRTDDLVVGQPVAGTGVAAATVIGSIDSPSQITLSQLPASNIVTTLTFSGGRGGMGRAIVQNGTTATGSPIITGLASTAGLALHQPVSGTGIPSSTYILTIDGSSQVTLSANATANGSPALTFTGGSAVGRGPVTINNGGTLMGDGVAGIVTNNSGGTIDPGVFTNTVAMMQFGTNVVFMAGSTQQVDIASDLSCDQLLIYGNVTLAGTVNPNLLGSYNPSAGSWTIATYTGTASGSMAAPGRYLVTYDNVAKKVTLTKRPNATGFIIGIY